MGKGTSLYLEGGGGGGAIVGFFWGGGGIMTAILKGKQFLSLTWTEKNILPPPLQVKWMFPKIKTIYQLHVSVHDVSGCIK